MKTAKLSLFDITMIVISLVVGMGIFRTPVNVARDAGSPSVFFAAWIIGGVVALCGALTFAEIGSRYPVTGGYYKIFSYCYHPSLAFAISCIALVSNAASVAGMALIGAEYFSNLFFSGSHNNSTIRLVISALAIGLFYGVNLMGLKMSARTQNVLMLIKMGLVIMLISSLFTVHHEETSPVITGISDNSWSAFFKSLGICLIAVSFTYEGYEQTINFGGEAENAPKTLPRGIFLGIIVCTLLYLSINYTYFKVIGFSNLQHAESIAALLAGVLFGGKGFAVISILMFLAVLASVNVFLMSNPRVIYAMGDEGVLPRLFAKRHPRTQVMTNALTAFTAICLITLFYAKTFDEILNHVIFIDCFSLATSASAIFILRKRTAHLDNQGIYKMKFFPLMPLVFIATYMFVAASIVIATPKAAGVSLLIFSLFFLLYFILKKVRRNAGNTDQL
ncbi:MAG: APC family permease [Flavitalea sp.]